MTSKNLLAIFISLTLCLMSINAIAENNNDNEKPGVQDIAAITIQATVKAIDYKKREVTLEGQDGKTVKIEVPAPAKNLSQVHVGDVVTVDYLEAVTVQVYAPHKAPADSSAESMVLESKPGQKPDKAVVNQISVLTTIEAINKKKEVVTLKTEDGKTETVKVRNPENLEKVKVGDKVMITYTEAIALRVTPKPKEKK